MATYQRSNAVAYAEQWYDGNNSNYTWFGKSATGVASPIGGNGDCANFVSQCLYAGGLRFKETGSAYRQWYYYHIGGSYDRKSSSWSGANDLRMFVRDTQDAPRLNVSEVAWANRATQLEEGDLIFRLKSFATSENNKRNIEAKHVAIVKSVSSSGVITVYQHTPYECSEWETTNGMDTALYHVNSIDTASGGDSGGGDDSGETSGYSTWQEKYGNNTFVHSNSYSGNVYRFQVDMNKWRTARSYTSIGTDGKWGNESEAATLLFQQAYSDLTDDGLCGPATKAKLFSLHGT